MTDLVLAIRMKADGSGQVKAEVREVTGGVDGLKRKLEDTGRAGADAGRGVESFRSKLGGLKAAIAGLGITALVRDIARTGVEFQKFEVGLLAATGSTQQANAELAFLREEAERLGLRFTSLAGSYTQLAAASKGTALEGKATRDIFTAVAEASRVMGLSSAEAEGALRAIGQMMSKGTVQAEELRGQLGERIPGAFQLAARAMGVTTAELGDMLQEGSVLADDLLPKLAEELRNAVRGGVDNAANTPAAEFERLGNALDDLKIAIAENGLLNALAEMVGWLTKGARWAGAMVDKLNDLNIAGMQRRLYELGQERADLVEEQASGPSLFDRLFGDLPTTARPANTRIRALDIEMAQLRRRLTNLSGERLRDQFGDFDEEGYDRPYRQPRSPSSGGSSGRSRNGRRTREAKAEEDLTLKIQEEFDRRRGAYIESLGDRLDALERSLDDELEREQRRYREAVELLADAEQQRITTSAEAQRIREGLEEQHLERVYQISQARIKRTEREVEESTKEMRDAVREVGDAFTSAFQEAVTSGGKLRDVLAGLLQDLSNLLAKSALDGLTGGGRGKSGGLLGGLFSGLGGLFGGGGGGGFLSGGVGASASVFDSVGSFALTAHEGGVVGKSARMRVVDPRVFAGAPRYHSGGLVANERPAVLQLGEEVLTRNDPRHVANGGGRGVAVTQNITIDARGADQGVEQRLRVALERNKRETIAQVRSEIVRGGPMRGLVRG